ncbi:uncharacterized protein [Aristolochia californica]|uniref:uncharacterized protein n=1 Tax=Aristolochia californica TaxID=171875 RepID=UPI0035DF61A3
MTLALSKAFQSVVDIMQTLPQHRQIILCSLVKLFVKGGKATTVGEKLKFSFVLVAVKYILLGCSSRTEECKLEIDEADITFALLLHSALLSRSEFNEKASKIGSGIYDTSKMIFGLHNVNLPVIFRIDFTVPISIDGSFLARYIYRAVALQNVESTISELDGIFMQLATMVTQQGELAIRIDDNMDESLANKKSAGGALLKHLNRISSNREVWREETRKRLQEKLGSNRNTGIYQPSLYSSTVLWSILHCILVLYWGACYLIGSSIVSSSSYDVVLNYAD